MKVRTGVIFLTLVSLSALSGCATIKEASKGFAGVSTKVLEDKRKDALKKSFNLNYNDCYKYVKEKLAQKGKDGFSPYIYWEDAGKKLIAIYLSEQDTTPVGIFFTEESAASTLVEISSPSIYAKEEIAKNIFKEEKKTDVKEKPIN